MVPNPSLSPLLPSFSLFSTEPKWYLKHKPDNITLLLKIPQWLFIILRIKVKLFYPLIPLPPLCFSGTALFSFLASSPHLRLPWAFAPASLYGWNIHPPDVRRTWFSSFRSQLYLIIPSLLPVVLYHTTLFYFFLRLTTIWKIAHIFISSPPNRN